MKSKIIIIGIICTMALTACSSSGNKENITLET